VSSRRRTLRRLLLGAAAGVFILSALVVGAGFGRGTICTRRDRTVLDIRNLEKGLELYHARTGKFPDSATGFNVLVETQILDRFPRDGWGNEYLYALVDGKPLITSWGSDGQPGGDDDATDLSNASTTVTRL
jgi:Type II secretion system (T2SS), protein G